MAYSSADLFDWTHRNGAIAFPSSLVSGWSFAISAGGMTIQDAPTITNPESQITSSTRIKLNKGSRGALLLLSMGYSSGLSGITSPVVKVFGRTAGDRWQTLKSRGGNLVETLTATAATDDTDGTLSYTIPDFAVTAWDCLGCDQLIVGIQTALAGTGTTSTAFLQAKVI